MTKLILILLLGSSSHYGFAGEESDKVRNQEKRSNFSTCEELDSIHSALEAVLDPKRLDVKGKLKLLSGQVSDFKALFKQIEVSGCYLPFHSIIKLVRVQRLLRRFKSEFEKESGHSNAYKKLYESSEENTPPFDMQLHTVIVRWLEEYNANLGEQIDFRESDTSQEIQTKAQAIFSDEKESWLGEFKVSNLKDKLALVELLDEGMNLKKTSFLDVGHMITQYQDFLNFKTVSEVYLAVLNERTVSAYLAQNLEFKNVKITVNALSAEVKKVNSLLEYNHLFTLMKENASQSKK